MKLTDLTKSGLTTKGTFDKLFNKIKWWGDSYTKEVDKENIGTITNYILNDFSKTIKNVTFSSQLINNIGRVQDNGSGQPTMYGMEGKTIRMGKTDILGMTGIINFKYSSGYYNYSTGFYRPEIYQSGKRSDLAIPPTRAAGNLILTLSTGQRIFGGFNFSTCQFYAHAVGPESTDFSLGNLKIHDFVTKWEEGYSYIAKINQELIGTN